ncbi:metallophosphoesterase family protein [Pseudooceanicola sp. LIPI14-2-Ac024]|uniref:metallophosphoesterase family protein n=1 Tax=Pseudooceanicola sp. LIPI14-2-Ac024 TaxID=3344875 RepID=UPI0035D0C24D
MSHSLPGRIAVIADIHGNSDALAAVLRDAERQDVGAVINLGDHFSGPLDAAGTAAILARQEMFALRGNHDRYLVEQAPEEMGPSDRVAHDALDPATLGWLRGLPPVLEFDGVFACHAMPRQDNAYWTHRATAEGGVTLRPRAEIEAAADGIDAALILCAHTHLPLTMRLPGGRRLVNPGSVGCPGYSDDLPVPHVVETGSPDACYAICIREGAGWRVDFRHVVYDPTRMATRARKHGREGWARAVETGWYSKA